MRQFTVLRLLFLVVLVLVTSCGKEKPAKPQFTNPLDERNPDTQGDPFELRAMLGGGGVQLAWEAVHIPGLSGYTIHRSMGDSTQLAPHASVESNRTSYVDSGVENGNTYFYKVTARSGMVESSPSNVAAVSIHTDPMIVIDSGAEYTESKLVDVTIIAANATEMALSNTDTAPSSFEPFRSLVEDWELLPGDGTKTIFLRVKYSDGTGSSRVDDTIVLDTEIPSAITDLHAEGLGCGRALLTWSAPLDNLSTASYDIRWATQAIGQANWESSEPLDGEPVPGMAGTSEKFLVNGIGSGPLWFCIRTHDGAGNVSPLSNNAQASLFIASDLDPRGWAAGSSIAIDSSGDPHVSYRGTEGTIYAKKVDGEWVFDVVDPAFRGTYTSLALGDNEAPHICYGSNFRGLWYAYRSADVWIREEIDSADNVGDCCSMALDSEGLPHVSYYDYSNQALKYAVRSEEGWHPETVDPDADIGELFGTTIDLDSNDAPHISYTGMTGIMYAVKTDATWIIDSVEGSSSQDRFSSMALDANDVPHISYWDFLDDHVEYARLDNGVWTTETIDSDGMLVGGTSIALDAHGRPHVTYVDWKTLEQSYLKFAYRADTGWKRLHVDCDGDIDYMLSMGISRAGYIHIAYFDVVAISLKYAVRIPY